MPQIQKDTLGSREDTLRFLDLVGMFGTQAMIGLGKLAHPATGKAEKNLETARVFIDILEMIEHKTRGNLTADEVKILQSTLTDLRLMYVDESKAPATAAEKPPAPDQPSSPDKPESPVAETPASTEEPKPSAPAEDDPKVKFHKKYE